MEHLEFEGSKRVYLFLCKNVYNIDNSESVLDMWERKTTEI